ncbi:MAG TPA: hypothetical protein PLI06_05495 [Methanofastidiosum sp.]|nr:hypothetical protein [Methanofastidiosum sp.]
MKIDWIVTDSDISKVKAFYEMHKDNPLVLNRIKRNINGNIPEVTKEIFWKEMITCLLSTQQRSGPSSPITKFVCTKPFLLDYSICSHQHDLKRFIEKTITDFGGIRRGKSISEEASLNYNWLNNGGWEEIFRIIGDLKKRPSKETELECVDVLIDNLRGFGPKQSRNLLLGLGLTRYEVPIDSRITKWLKEFGFPIALSAATLADRNYFNFVSEGFQQICNACGISPCVLDAAIFSSFDTEKWSDENM